MATSILAKNQKELDNYLDYLKDKTFDLIEFRADKLESLTIDEIDFFLGKIKSLNKPLIFTLRREGEAEISDSSYWTINKHIIENQLADYIDLELSSLEGVKLPSFSKPALIVSSHNYSGLVSRQEFFDKLGQMDSFKPFYKKLAYKLNKPGEDDILLGWAKESGEDNLIVIGMGPYGRKTRLANKTYKSQISFYKGLEEGASGQVGLDEQVFFYEKNYDIGRISLYSRANKLIGLSINERIRDDGLERKTPLMEEAFNQLDDYFLGLRKEFDLAWELEAKGFQKQVLMACSILTYGQRVSYKDLASMAGSKGAYRAAGTSLAKNPLAIIIPCHRVVNINKDISNYRYGRDTKKYLLDLEDRNK